MEFVNVTVNGTAPCGITKSPVQFETLPRKRTVKGKGWPLKPIVPSQRPVMSVGSGSG
jgi:hypothetical protein